MSLTFLGWIFIVSSIALPALVVFSRGEQLPLDIRSRLKLRKLDEKGPREAGAIFLSRLRPSRLSVGTRLPGTARGLTVAAAAFLVVAGIGAASSYLRTSPSSDGATTDTSTSPGGDDEMLANLADYTRSIKSEEPASNAAANKLLPDVNTMIEQLADRLKTAPQDIQGWRMLGWSYFNTERYDQAVTAYAKAIELDPNSAELKTSYEQAKAKASGGSTFETASTGTTGAVQTGTDEASVTKLASSEAAPPHENDAAIRSMVDGLADRLDHSPRDLDGWTRLMRSRVVLGEREDADTAFRKALDVFKDDSAASGTIMAAAIELGLKAE